jgi:hypothetical protein
MMLLGASCTGQPLRNEAVRIGAPDGVGLILARYAAGKLTENAEVTQLPSVTEIFDCCSSTTQWALSSGSLDAAILCPDEAQSLVKVDKRYTILGPCLVNSVIVVIKDPSRTDIIGIARNRRYQQDVVSSLFGRDSHTRQMLPQSLPAAYERGLVDGVVVEIEQASQMEGIMLPVNSAGQDVVTYMLVIRKDLPGRDLLTRAFSAAAAELNEQSNLQKAVKDYISCSNSETRAAQWLQTGMKFLSVSQDAVISNLNEGDSSEKQD